MRNPSKIESDQLKYDASPIDVVENVFIAPKPAKLSVNGDSNPEPEKPDKTRDE